MKIKVDQLEKAVLALIKELKDSNNKEIELKQDYYWNILNEQIYDIYSRPEELTIGSLVDDWSELEKIADDPDEALIYSLIRLASILRALAIQQTR